ncbi:hypothetical protein IV203_037728 [Nitzschia inconspicua]|uniref:Myb-like domain-containing protein n=1 Tax=Nitzschia inconspicua TaxID=303405 RepID=A0A9K3PYU7_9STRA|nr:hypothetical protein IV203_037728 [Nitzschia inconspicua]
MSDDENNILQEDEETPSSTPIAFSDTMLDLASWWCHYILQNSRLELFDELSEMLEFVAPIEEGSPFSIRLHCLVVWQELLQQTTPRVAIATIDPGDTTAQYPPLESRTFEAVQDKLVLIHTKYFRHDTAALQEYQEVVRMIRVHHELAILYRKLKDVGKDPNEVNLALDHALQKGRDDIYFGGNHQIPLELQDIVVKENGFSTEKRLQSIMDILHDTDSQLAVKWLLLKTQMVLLHWCEWKIPGGAPVLVKSNYQGVGVVTRNPEGSNEIAGTNSSAITETMAPLVPRHSSSSACQEAPKNGPGYMAAANSDTNKQSRQSNNQQQQSSRALHRELEGVSVSRVPPSQLLGRKRRCNGSDEEHSLESNKSNNSSPRLASIKQILTAKNQNVTGRGERSAKLSSAESSAAREGENGNGSPNNLSASVASDAEPNSKLQKKKWIKIPGKNKATVLWTSTEDDALMEGVKLKGTNWIFIKKWAGERLATKSKHDLRERHAALCAQDENLLTSENSVTVNDF